MVSAIGDTGSGLIFGERSMWYRIILTITPLKPHKTEGFLAYRKEISSRLHAGVDHVPALPWSRAMRGHADP